MTLDRGAERAAMFEHAWRQTREKLYVKDMNGVNWDDYKAAYARFLPFIADNRDFAELLSEMLGELNVSHTGASFRPRIPGADATASLGLFADDQPMTAAVGRFVHVYVDRQTRRPVPLPERLLAALNSLRLTEALP
jgi:hypothetical protein